MFIFLYIIIYPLYWLLLFTSFKTPNAVHIYEVKYTYTKSLPKLTMTQKVFIIPRSHLESEMELFGPLHYESRLNDERTILKVSFSISGERSPTNMWWCSEVSFFCVTAWAGPPHKHIHHYLSDSFKYLGLNQSWKLLYWIPLIPVAKCLFPYSTLSLVLHYIKKFS